MKEEGEEEEEEKEGERSVKLYAAFTSRAAAVVIRRSIVNH